MAIRLTIEYIKKQNMYGNGNNTKKQLNEFMGCK